MRLPRRARRTRPCTPPSATRRLIASIGRGRVAGRDHEIAVPASAQDGRLGNHRDIAEDVKERSELHSRRRERRTIGDVQQVGAARTQHTRHTLSAFDCAQRLRRYAVRERIAHDDVEFRRPRAVEYSSCVGDPEPELFRCPPGQFRSHELDKSAVDLDHNLRRRRTRRHDVSRQRCRAPAEMQGIERRRQAAQGSRARRRASARTRRRAAADRRDRRTSSRYRRAATCTRAAPIARARASRRRCRR